MTKLTFELLVVFGCQSSMAWLFYRSRALTHSSWTDSDAVVFGVPLVAGFAASALMMFLSAFPQAPASRRIAAILGLAAGGSLISSFVGTVIAFNLYGT